MSAPLVITACVTCGLAAWPPRPVCARCGHTDFAPADGAAGVIEERTACDGPLGFVELGTVRLAAGPVVIARLAPDTALGPVTLTRDDDDGVLEAR